MEYPPARSRSRLSERPSHHGADSVHLVSSDRPQSAEICAQHLSGYGGRLCSCDAARLLFAHVAVASCPPGHSLGKKAREQSRAAITTSALLSARSPVLTQPRRQLRF